MSAPEPKPSRQRASNALSLRGEYWEVTYDGHSAIVEDCRGLRYIALLIQNAAADRGPVHARELVALATGRTEAPVELEAKDELLDAAARKQLVKRLEELAEERERACAAQDFDKALGVDEEYERIASQLKLGAKSARSGRGTFADTGEKARKAVGKAITEAIARIAVCKELASLAQHLNGAVRKGQWLSYTGREDWRIDFRVPLPRK